MKNKLLSFTPVGFLLAAFILAVVPAWAQNLDDRIKALEAELGQLKAEQMEMRKEATAAAAAMPDFTYRPGAGLSIRGADRSWEIRFRSGFNINLGFFPSTDARGDAAASEGTLAGHSAGPFPGRVAFPQDQAVI